MNAQTAHSCDPELAQHISELVAAAPPLRAEQIDQIAAIIQAGAT